MPSIISSSFDPPGPQLLITSPCGIGIARLKKAMRSLSALGLRDAFVNALQVYPKTIDGLVLIFESSYLVLEYLVILEEQYECELKTLSKKIDQTEEEQNRIESLGDLIDNIEYKIVFNVGQIKNQLFDFLEKYMFYAKPFVADIYDILEELCLKKKDLNRPQEVLDSGNERTSALRDEIAVLDVNMTLEYVENLGERAQLTYLPEPRIPSSSVLPVSENWIRV